MNFFQNFISIIFRDKSSSQKSLVFIQRESVNPCKKLNQPIKSPLDESRSNIQDTGTSLAVSSDGIESIIVLRVSGCKTGPVSLELCIPYRLFLSFGLFGPQSSSHARDYLFPQDNRLCPDQLRYTRPGLRMFWLSDFTKIIINRYIVYRSQLIEINTI